MFIDDFRDIDDLIDMAFQEFDFFEVDFEDIVPETLSDGDSELSLDEDTLIA